MLISEHLFQHVQRLQLGEVGNVQAVIPKNNLKQAPAVVVRQLEQPHGGEVHAHHQLNQLGLAGRQHVVVDGLMAAEAAGAKVEETALGVALQVGVEAQETAEAHKKHQVEVGIMSSAVVEPLHARHYIVEERLVALLASQGMVEEFGHEKRDGHLVGVEGYRHEGRLQPRVAQLLQL